MEFNAQSIVFMISSIVTLAGAVGVVMTATCSQCDLADCQFCRSRRAICPPKRPLPGCRAGAVYIGAIAILITFA